MKTTITIKNLQKKLYPNAKRIKQAVLKALSQLDFKKSIELSICFVTDAKIRRLNLRYRGSDEPTDVLTFDNSIDRGRLLADIVVSTDTAIRNSKIFKTSSHYEIYLYVVHGLLHLAGYQDKNLRQAGIMDKLAGKICQYTKPKP